MPQPYVTPKQLSEINKINEASEQIVQEAEKSAGGLNFYTIDISDLSFIGTSKMELPDADKLLEAIQNGDLIKIRYASKAEEGVAPDLGFLVGSSWFTWTEAVIGNESIVLEIILAEITKTEQDVYQLLAASSTGGRAYNIFLDLSNEEPKLKYNYTSED